MPMLWEYRRLFIPDSFFAWLMLACFGVSIYVSGVKRDRRTAFEWLFIGWLAALANTTNEIVHSFETFSSIPPSLARVLIVAATGAIASLLLPFVATLAAVTCICVFADHQFEQYWPTPWIAIPVIIAALDVALLLLGGLELARSSAGWSVF